MGKIKYIILIVFMCGCQSIQSSNLPQFNDDDNFGTKIDMPKGEELKMED